MLVLLFVAFLAASAFAKKPAGKIPDLAAFSQIHSYCVDSSGLAGDEALDLTNFVNAESKPKKLLSKLPWTLVRDCSQGPPDAVVRVEFSQYYPVSGVQTGSPTQGNGPAQEEFYKIRVTLRVSPAESSQVLYEIEAAPLSNSITGQTVEPVDESLPVQRRNSIYDAFWKLIQDVQRVS
jgi:hypothetical protein